MSQTYILNFKISVIFPRKVKCIILQCLISKTLLLCEWGHGDLGSRMLSSNGWHLFLSSVCSAPSSHLLLLLVILKMQIGISMRARAFVQCRSGQMATTPDKAPRTTLSIPFFVKSWWSQCKLLYPCWQNHQGVSQTPNSQTPSRPTSVLMGGVRHGLVSEDPSCFSYAAGVERHPQSPKGSTSGIMCMCSLGLFINEDSGSLRSGVTVLVSCCVQLICDGYIFSFEWVVY